MSTEQRLRDAMAAEAARVEPSERWARIEAAIDAGPRRSPARYLSLAAALVALLAAAIVVVNQRDTDRQPVTAGQASTTIAPTTVVPVTATPYLWPFDYSGTYQTPEALAEAFAKDFLGMPDPTVSTYRAGDAHSGEIDVHPYSTGTIGSMLVVREDQDGWHVVSALSDNLELEEPTVGERITSPVHLTGRSIAFEGTVRVAILQYGTTMRCVQPTDSCGANHGVLANTFFTGHGSEKAPFATDVTFNRSATDYGLLVLWTDSARDGSLAEATIRLVRFA